MSCHCCCNCSAKEHVHCYHPFMGPVAMVIPPNHTVEECCMCGNIRLKQIFHPGWHGSSPYKATFGSTLPDEFAQF